MNKKLLLGAALGVISAAIVIGHVIKDRNSRELFAERIRCKQLADKYVKEQSNLGFTIFLNRVEFSRSRGSCIASTQKQILGSGPKIYEVIDLLTSEEVEAMVCRGDQCIKVEKKLDAEINEIVK